MLLSSAKRKGKKKNGDKHLRLNQRRKNKNLKLLNEKGFFFAFGLRDVFHYFLTSVACSRGWTISLSSFSQSFFPPGFVFSFLSL